MNRLIFFLVLLSFLGCNSDKEELVKQFEYTVDENNNSKKIDPFFENGQQEKWFLMGRDSVGGYIVQKENLTLGIESGHYFMKTDFSFKSIQKVKMTDFYYNSNFKNAHIEGGSILAYKNTFKSIEFQKSIDGGSHWFEFFYYWDDDLSNEMTILLQNHEWDNFYMFNEYSGILGLSDYQGITIYSFQEGSKVSKLAEIPLFDLDDIKFIDNNNGFILAKKANNVLPSTEENAYLFKTTDGGKTWSDSILISDWLAYHTIIPIDMSTMLLDRTGRYGFTEDGGMSWEDYNVKIYSAPVIDSDRALYGFDAVANKYPFDGFLLMRSLDYGKSWGIYSNDTLWGINPILELDKLNQALVYFETGQVYISENKGKNWILVKEGS